MNVQKIVAASAASVLSLGIAVPAFADISVDAAVDTVTRALQGSGSVNASGNASAKANAGGNASTSAGIGADVRATIQGVLNGSSSTTTNGNGSVASGGSVSVAVLAVTRADVDNGAVAATVSSPSEVKADTDLPGYIASQIKADANVQSVNAASDEVSLTYKQHAKFLGFIPVLINTTATVNAGGAIELHYPWYAIFTSTNKAALEAKLQQQVNANVSANANASGTLNAQTRAQIIAAIQAAMQDEFSADAAVEPAADAAAGGTVETGTEAVGDIEVQ